MILNHQNWGGMFWDHLAQLPHFIEERTDMLGGPVSYI